jgi:hypothetical protein
MNIRVPQQEIHFVHQGYIPYYFYAKLFEFDKARKTLL